jgi:SAM-dependent methyltransferase
MSKVSKILHGQSLDDSYAHNWTAGLAKRKIQWVQDFQFVQKTFQPITSGMRVLDIGCGDGGFSQFFLDAGAKVFGVEVIESQAQKARERSVEILTEVPSAGEFDLVILRGVLQYVSDQYAVLEQISKITAPGGAICILQTPNSESFQFRRWGLLPGVEDPPFTDLALIPSFATLHGYFLRKNFQVKRHYPYWKSPYQNFVPDLLAVIAGAISGRYPGRSFPRNMFHLVALKGPGQHRKVLSNRPKTDV